MAAKNERWRGQGRGGEGQGETLGRLVGGEAQRKEERDPGKGGQRPRERGTETWGEGNRDTERGQRPRGVAGWGRQILTGGAQSTEKWRSEIEKPRKNERQRGQKPTEPTEG